MCIGAVKALTKLHTFAVSSQLWLLADTKYVLKFDVLAHNIYSFHEDTFLKKIKRVIIPFTLYINSSIQIKFSFVSPYPTDPKKGPTQNKLFQFSVKNFFLIPLQT